jgi:hypothetical protein
VHTRGVKEGATFLVELSFYSSRLLLGGGESVRDQI